jgi:hypothetical protein
MTEPVYGFVDAPTDDETPDGTQLPTEADMPAEEGDAGVGLAELPDSVFEDGES